MQHKYPPKGLEAIKHMVSCGICDMVQEPKYKHDIYPKIKVYECIVSVEGHEFTLLFSEKDSYYTIVEAQFASWVFHWTPDIARRINFEKAHTWRIADEWDLDKKVIDDEGNELKVVAINDTIATLQNDEGEILHSFISTFYKS